LLWIRIYILSQNLSIVDDKEELNKEGGGGGSVRESENIAPLKLKNAKKEIHESEVVPSTNSER
jgi:hypothetical protein